MTDQRRTLELGNVYFFYRPRIEEDSVEGLEDVQRFYMVLHPRGRDLFRVLVVGRKRLPDVGARKEREWAFVEQVTPNPKDVKDALGEVTYETRTRGRRVQPAARPGGAGVYAIVRHDDHTHLAYALELPGRPGRVQEDLNIESEASYIVSVRNPDAPAPPGFGPTGTSRRAAFPEHLRKQFGERRFIPIDPPEFLDYEGAEILLIGATSDPENELGIDIDRENETRQKDDLLRDLRLELANAPVEPLVAGEWR
jgi:hypothetical protein